jgi:hypothetical protein
MNKNIAIDKIKNLIDRLDKLPPYQFKGDNSSFIKWYRDTEIAIENIFGQKTRHINDFKGVRFNLSVVTPSTQQSDYIKQNSMGRANAKVILSSLVDEITEYWTDNIGEETINNIDSKGCIVNIINNFHRAARQLLIRYSKRNTLKINDEYDVQDLLHTFLKLHFDDIREEEYSPSYAGSSSRIDFLLNDQKIAIEVKKTRTKLTDKEIGEELMIDIMRYEAHPKVKSLICFVYDPEGKIKNPAGLENDLSKTHNNLDVEVIICPKF